MVDLLRDVKLKGMLKGKLSFRDVFSCMRPVRHGSRPMAANGLTFGRAEVAFRNCGRHGAWFSSTGKSAKI